ncbi:YqeG family HAD IIIA-type phosphatase [Altericista sp. CCNU0014]|uniref:YqeG family HAD IIIA-type phosphatase n=1 Tax=Altericista sp. CCNU0014 TaxID=3082949 RepID=UPI00384FDF0A
MLPRAAVSLLEPNLTLSGSILALTPALIKHYGLRGLVLDVDDTVISTRSAVVPPEVKVWMEEIKQVVCVTLVSNNLSHARIRRVAGVLDLPYIFGARKPSRRKVRQAVSAMNLPLHEVGMVGDRLFTDVLVGNRLGMFTVLVEPMMDSKNSRRRMSWLRAFELWLSQVLSALFKL